MQKIVEALKRKEREEAAKQVETADAFRAKFASIYGPKKDTRTGTQNGPGAGSKGAGVQDDAGNDAGTVQDAPGAGTPTGTPPDNAKPVQANFDLNTGDPGRDGGETDPENAPERLPDDGEVPPDPAERTRMSQEREDGAGTDEDTPGAKKPVQARKSGNGKGRGKGNAGKRVNGRAGKGKRGTRK